jgi:hypothetical protein
LPRPLLVGLVILISIAWTVNLAVGYLNPGLGEPSVNAIFAIVVGALFALGRRDKPSTVTARKKIAKLIDPGEPDDRGDRT